MLFITVVTTSDDVAATRSRRRKVEILTPFLQAAAAHELQTVTAWLTGSLRQGRIGLGPTILREVTSTPPATGPTLAVSDVNATINRLAGVSGKGAMIRRHDLLTGLMRQATHQEQAFLLKLLLGDLRQGALDGVMTETIAAASEINIDLVRRAVMLSGDLPAVAGIALTDGVRGLACFRMQPGTPVQAMLAKTALDVDEALELFGEAYFDYKIDGARVQIHRDNGKVSIYSRQMNNVTDSLPEISSLIGALPGGDLILDGEVIALADNGQPHPFQVTMKRFGRRTNVAALSKQIPLTLFLFDILYNGEDLSDRTTTQRHAIMRELLPAKLIVPRRLTDDPATALAHYNAALDDGHEGVMAKSPQSPYLAGSRGAGWLKIKPAHSLDLIVLAAEWGSGRRMGWLSNLHLGAYDPEQNKYVMLGKTFKGLTDKMLDWQTDKLQTLETHRDAQTVYVRPELVVEIAFSNLQRSRQYAGGLALRFARVKAFRLDKDVAEADTFATVRQLYNDSRRIRA